MSWKESTEGTIYLPETADIMSMHNSNDISDLISQAIMEVLFKFVAGEDPLKDIAVDASLDCQDSPSSQTSPMFSPILAYSSNPPTTLNTTNSDDQSPQTKSLIYLFDSYSRVAVEERNHPKVFFFESIRKLFCKRKTLKTKLY